MRWLGLAAIVASAACVLNYQVARREAVASYDFDDYTSFEFGAVRVADAVAIRGVASSGARARAEIRMWLPGGGSPTELDGVELRFEQQGGQLGLALQYEGSFAETLSIGNLDVDVLPATDLHLTLAEGALVVAGVTGDVTVQGGAASVDLGTTGDVAVTSRAGDVRAQGDNVVVRTSSGSIDVVAADMVELISTTGPITATVGGGGVIATGRGAISVRWQSLGGALSIQGADGPVELLVDTGAGFELQVATDGGRIEIEPGLGSGGPVPSGGGWSYSGLIAGGGTGRVEILSGSGPVSVRRL